MSEETQPQQEPQQDMAPPANQQMPQDDVEASAPPPAPEPVPEGMVAMRIRSRANASRTVSTRWGAVEFDKDGYAEIEVNGEDIARLEQLQWLTPEDRAKYVGKPAAKPSPKAEALDSTREKLAQLQRDHARMQEAFNKWAEDMTAKNDALESQVEKLQAEVATQKKAMNKAAAEAKKAAADAKKAAKADKKKS